MIDTYMADRVNKKTSSDYRQIIGYVKSDVALDFKALCTLKEITISEALETAVIEWMKNNK